MSLLHQASEQLDGSADDFQEGINSNVRKDLKGRYRMDAALEDRICDLYDLYIEVPNPYPRYDKLSFLMDLTHFSINL